MKGCHLRCSESPRIAARTAYPGEARQWEPPVQSNVEATRQPPTTNREHARAYRRVVKQLDELLVVFTTL